MFEPLVAKDCNRSQSSDVAFNLDPSTADSSNINKYGYQTL